VRLHHLLPIASLLAVAACGSDDAAQPAATTSTAASSFPVDVDSCGEPFTLDAAPERVVLLSNDPISPLAAIGALDRVVATTGDVQTDLYDAATAAAAEAIPRLTAGTGSTGGTEISQEAIIDQEPDLVIGYETETITRAGLRAVGIPLYVIPAFCPDGASEPVAFNDVGDALEVYGRMFGAAAEAARVTAELDARVAAVREAAAEAPARTGAVLYVPAGGGTLYAYGPASMAHPQMAALGIDNAFADLDERVVEITREELIARNPDVLVLLYGEDGDPEAAERTVRELPGAEAIAAVTSGSIVAQPFPLTDPPNPLSVTGLEQLAEQLLR
jgi:iron complex transport system substrate-binding protein